MQWLVVANIILTILVSVVTIIRIAVACAAQHSQARANYVVMRGPPAPAHTGDTRYKPGSGRVDAGYAAAALSSMCNLYSVTKGQKAILEAYRAMHDRTGNLPPLPGIFPDQMAPVVRNGADGRELAMLRWGFPCPPGVPGNRAVTNIRNTASSYWRAWMKPEWRCLVPATAFCEYGPGKPALPHWFALDENRPLFALAGLWRPWTGTRGTKADPLEGEHHLFAFLTCEPNAVVAPIHPKAMPVILTTPEDCEMWLTAPAAEALALQRPLPDGALQIVARGEKQDPPAAAPEMAPALLL